MAPTQTIKVDEDTRYLDMTQAMFEAGCPRDQAAGYIKSGYVPLRTMLGFHAAAREADRDHGPDEIGIGGTRGPGKSHAVMAQVGLDDCRRVPGLKALFLRKVQRAAAESFEDLVLKVFRYVERDYKPSLGRVVFPNGSRILIGGFKDDSDIDKYLGVEYDLLAIEEGTQISEHKKNLIYGSVRSSIPGWRTRKYVTTNPDGVGLQWFKNTFILPWRAGKQQYSRYFFASYKDNPFLSREYIRYLEGLKGPLGKAWRDGDFDAFEGMAFPNWDYDVHVIDPFSIPEHWVKWRAVDWGYANPWCCYWFAKEPDTGRIYVYREAYQNYLTDTQQAQMILDMTTQDERITLTFADPSMWTSKNMEGRISSTYDEYRDKGVLLTKADNDRLGGKRKVDRVLGMLPDGRPGLQIFRTCDNLTRTLPLLVFDDVHTEDVDTDQEDHAYDCLKYGLSNVKPPRLPSNQQQENRRRPPMAGIPHL
jgi:phage terminase large subunit